MDTTAFPSGAKVITMVFRDISMASIDQPVIKWHTSGGLVTSNYLGHSVLLHKVQIMLLHLLLILK